MRLAFVILAFLSLRLTSVYSQTNFGGVIDANTTLLVSESPYFVTKNTLVSAGVTLTIEPGVTLHFKDSVILQIDGTLRSIGTEQAPIVYTGMPGAFYYPNMPNYGHGWGGIYFSDSSTDYDTISGMGSIMQHTQITRVIGARWLYGSGPYTRETNPLFLSRCSPYISHTEIAFYTGYIGVDASNAIFRYCNFHHANKGIYLNALTYPEVGNPKIENCLFHDFNAAFISDMSIPIVLAGPVRFSNNCIRDINNEFALTIPYNGPEVLYNSFTNCSQVAIGNYNESYSYKIIGNSFTDNFINMTFTSCPRAPQIYGNNFNNYIDHNIYATQNYWITPGGIPISSDCTPSSTRYDLDVSNNYWGGLAPEEIETSIHDYNDDFIERINIVYEAFSATPFNLVEPEACNIEDQANPFSIGENNISTLHVWPNPISSKESLYITIVEAGTYQLNIMNILGQIIYNRGVVVNTNETIQQPLNNLPEGAYIISITSNKKHYTQRIIVAGN